MFVGGGEVLSAYYKCSSMMGTLMLWSLEGGGGSRMDRYDYSRLASSGRGLPAGGATFTGVAGHVTFTGDVDHVLIVPAEEMGGT